MSVVALEQSSSEARVAVTITGKPADPPRVAEIWLAHTDNLRFVDAAAGEAVGSKEFVVQPRRGNRVRTVIYSASDLGGIGEGAIGSYRFEKTGPGEARVEIEVPGQVFAPASANVGLVVGEPLVLNK